MKYFILLTIILEIIGLIKSELIIKPIKETGEDVALIIIIGALMKPSSYIPLAQEIQKASLCKLWVGIPSFIFNMPNPLTILRNSNNLIKEMEGLGMKTKLLFYGGHGFGGTVVQNHLYGKENVIGQIIMGSSLKRSYMSNLNEDGSSKMDYTVPTLTLNGCLDGLYRVTRVAESYYHHKLNQKNSTVVDNFPVVMVKGATHMQFSSGVPSTEIKNYDLIPEISDEEAHSTYGQIISSFMDFRMGKKAEILYNFIKQTEDILNPIIKALQFEGSYHLKPPCYDSTSVNRYTPTCAHGSPVAEIGQQIMSGLSLITQNVNITVDDNFHRTYSMTPYHHPEINNQCNSTNACTLNITTMSELNYETMDYMDMGYSNTAQEIKAKYISRQQLYIAAGYPNTTFDIDTNATCYDINKMVYDWALKKVPEDVKERYIKYGIPYEFGEDLGNYNGGMWIIEYITYELNAKKTAVIVRSPYMSTSMNMIKLFAGFHYCKVLSPARAIEWIYLDSLRQNLGLNTK